MQYAQPTRRFVPHPAGTYHGIIIEVRDAGETATKWGPKHRLAIVIQADTALVVDADGAPIPDRDGNDQPCCLWVWVTLSGDKRGSLNQLRQKLMGRELTPNELATFDDREMLNTQVEYVVEHTYNNGEVYDKLCTWRRLSVPGGARPLHRPPPARDTAPAHPHSAAQASAGQCGPGQASAAAAAPDWMDEAPPPDDSQAPPPRAARR